MKPEPSWIPRALEGDLDPREHAEFVHAVRNDPNLQEQWAKHAVLHGVLGPVMEQTNAREKRIAGCLKAAARADRDGFVSAVRHKIRWVQFRQYSTWAAAAVFVVSMLGFWNMASRTSVATVVRAHSTGPVKEGSRFSKGDTLKIDNGLVELDLDGRGRMIVQGPGEITWKTTLGSQLKSGRVFLKINERGHGYRLDTPQGSVVDLGTEFGVAIDPATHAVETHVILGKVEVCPGNAEVRIPLAENEALRFSTTRNEKIPVNARAFYRSLPPLRSTDMTMVHWSMDPGKDSIVPPRTHLIDRESTKLQLENYPKPVSGPFGKALDFSGRRDYATSEYPGIGGNDPRTLAFWVKVPADWEIRERYSMVTWGAFRKNRRGALWQVSANFIPEDGPLGRLRVDVNGSHTVGNTDLRDGQWHHVAVVLYPPEQTDSRQHVMVYIDGKLEPLTSPAIGPVRTDITKARYGVRLAGDNKGFGGGWRVFRGALDEVYIFDNVLSHDEIRTLMERNEPPVPVDR